MDNYFVYFVGTVSVVSLAGLFYLSSQKELDSPSVIPQNVITVIEDTMTQDERDEFMYCKSLCDQQDQAAMLMYPEGKPYTHISNYNRCYCGYVLRWDINNDYSQSKVHKFKHHITSLND